MHKTTEILKDKNVITKN